MPMSELKSITRSTGPVFKELWGTTIEGAEQALKNGVTRPYGLTDDVLYAYREIALRAVTNYQQTGNFLGIATQNARIKIINLLLLK